jgi:hypothetical protein
MMTTTPPPPLTTQCTACGGDGYYKGTRLGDEKCTACNGTGIASPPAGGVFESFRVHTVTGRTDPDPFAAVINKARADDDDGPLEVSEEAHELAHKALSRWIADCEIVGTEAFESGRMGYVGRLKLCAFADDQGITLRIERSIVEEL